MKISENIPLASLTTFRTGGRVRYLVEVENKEDLENAVVFAKDEKLPILILGGASNILVGDAPLNAVAIRLVNDDFEVVRQGRDSVQIRVGAGMNWDKLVAKTVTKGWQGIECLSGIPGSVGAAPIQNIGAYGQEFGNVFVGLDAYDLEQKQFIWLSKKDCRFGYRESLFKKEKDRYIVFSVTIKLAKGKLPQVTYDSLKHYLDAKETKNPSLAIVRRAVIAVRKSRFEDPKKVGNAGSFFKNPVISARKFAMLSKKYDQMPHFESENGVKLSAGWLIEQAGWKGRKFKSAAVSSQHALVLVNPGHALAADIKLLAQAVRKDVKRKFGIALAPEVTYINL